MSKAIGIDLGLNYVRVGVYHNQKIEIIPNEIGTNKTPCVVSFDGNERLIGQAGKEKITKNFKNTVYDAKRLIGRRFTDKIVQENMKRWPFKVEKDDKTDRPLIVVDYLGQKKKFLPEEISAMILGKMKKIAEDYVGSEVKNAIITVPAYFNDSQRQSTRDAGRIAGLNVMRIINEPTAAAIAYGLDNRSSEERIVLVFDLGGGTFDVSILSINEDTFEVKSSSGNTHLGGEDFDNQIMELCIQKFKEETGTDITGNQKALRKLKFYCESAKRSLSSAVETHIEIDNLAEEEDLDITITRVDFEEHCNELFERCFDSIKQAMEEASLSKKDIDDIVLVGGSSRIPKIQEMIKNYFNGKELCKNINADEAVAYGAAYQAAVVNGNENPKEKKENEKNEDDGLEKLVLVDVTPLSLGIETQGGVMSVVIRKNTPIPIKKTNIYKTIFDDQEEAKVSVFQGESKLVADNFKIGEFTIKIKGRGKAGSIKFKVIFEFDVNSVLNVTAKEIKEDNEENLVVTAEKMQLNDEEIEQKIQEAKQYDEEDRKRLEITKARIELQNLCFDKKKIANERQNKIIDEIIQWIKDNREATISDFEHQKKKLLDCFK